MFRTWKRWLQSWVVPAVLLALGVIFVFVGVLRTSTSFNAEFAGVTFKCGSAWEARSSELVHSPSTHLEVVGGSGSVTSDVSINGVIDKCNNTAQSRITFAIVLWVLAALSFIGAGVWAWRTGRLARLRR